MGLSPMHKLALNAGAKALKDHLKNNDSRLYLPLEDVNKWLEENNHPFEMEMEKETSKILIKLKES